MFNIKDSTNYINCILLPIENVDDIDIIESLHDIRIAEYNSIYVVNEKKFKKLKNIEINNIILYKDKKYVLLHKI